MGMIMDLPHCVCGGQPVVYDRGEMCVVTCSECKQFVTAFGKELALEEWRMRIHVQKGKDQKKRKG